MKKIKLVLATALILSMLMGVTSCSSGIKAQKFYDYAVDNLECEEYTLKKFKKVKDDKEVEKDGVIIHIEEDDVEDYFDIMDEDDDNNSSFDLSKCYVTPEDTKAKYVKEITEYMISESNTTDVSATGILVINFDNSSSARDAFESMLDRVEDEIDISPEDLSEDEYMYKGSNGYLLVHVDEDTFIDGVVDVLTGGEEAEYSKDDLEYFRDKCEEQFGDFNCYMATYLKGSSIVSIVCLTNEGETDAVEDFCEAFKLQSPLDVDNTKEFEEAIIENAFSNYGK